MKVEMNEAIEEIRARIAEIEGWLEENGNDCKNQQGHLVEKSIERVYWHFGYMMALKDVNRLVERVAIHLN